MAKRISFRDQPCACCARADTGTVAGSPPKCLDCLHCNIDQARYAPTCPKHSGATPWTEYGPPPAHKPHAERWNPTRMIAARRYCEQRRRVAEHNAKHPENPASRTVTTRRLKERCAPKTAPQPATEPAAEPWIHTGSIDCPGSAVDIHGEGGPQPQAPLRMHKVHPNQRTTRTQPFATRQGRLESIAYRASRHAFGAQTARSPHADAAFRRADRLWSAAINSEGRLRDAYERHRTEPIPQPQPGANWCAHCRRNFHDRPQRMRCICGRAVVKQPGTYTPPPSTEPQQLALPFA